MAMTDVTRRLQTRIIFQDIESYDGFRIVDNYTARRPEATLEALQGNLTWSDPIPVPPSAEGVTAAAQWMVIMTKTVLLE